MKPQLFIIEGPDSTGKSSLAKFIALKRKAVYSHASGKKSLHFAMLDYHVNMIENANVNLSNGHDVVFDRHWPSEWCYGQVLRKHVSDRYYDFGVIDQLLRNIFPIYIFCESHESFKRHAMSHDDTDHKYQKEQYVQICGEYNMLAEKIKPFRYSIEEHGTDMGKFLEGVMSRV
jgi:thymidylate kinase